MGEEGRGSGQALDQLNPWPVRINIVRFDWSIVDSNTYLRVGVSNLFLFSGGVADGGLVVYFGVEIAWGDFEANKLHVGAVGFDMGSGPVSETYVGRWAYSYSRPTPSPPAGIYIAVDWLLCL